MKKFSNLARKIFSFLHSLFEVQIGVAKIENIFIRKQEEFSSFFLLQHVSERGCKINQVFRFSKGFKNNFFGLVIRLITLSERECKSSTDFDLNNTFLKRNFSYFRNSVLVKQLPLYFFFSLQQGCISVAEKTVVIAQSMTI